MNAVNAHMRQNEHDIRLTHVAVVPTTFHARFSATAREYSYRICTHPREGRTVFDQLFEQDRCWSIDAPLDLPAMQVRRWSLVFAMHPTALTRADIIVCTAPGCR